MKQIILKNGKKGGRPRKTQLADKKPAEFFIKHPQKNIEEPAWKHADGTLISFWDSLPELLIQDDDGARLISHDTAKELGYNN